MDVRVSRASSVIVHRVPPEARERFLEWQRGVAEVMAQYAGYQATDVYPPVAGQAEWVIVLHFDGPESLHRWMESADRAEWITTLRHISEFQIKTLPGGFGGWFTGLLERPSAPLPPWKMALTVLLGLYPTVMVQSIFLMPHTTRFGPALAVLIGNVLSVCLLQWAVMPALQRILRPWLRASGPRGKTVTAWGLILILAAMAGFTLLFRAVAG